MENTIYIFPVHLDIDEIADMLVDLPADEYEKLLDLVIEKLTQKLNDENINRVQVTFSLKLVPTLSSDDNDNEEK